MNRLTLILSIVVTIGPSVAFAGGLELQVGPNYGAGAVDAVVAPGTGEHFFDLTFLETPPDQNEGMDAYDVMVRAPRPGISLLRAEKPGDDWAFGPEADAHFTVPESAPDHLLIEVTIPPAAPLTDLMTGTKAARVYYAVDPAAPPGVYDITLDPQETGIASGLPNRALPPPVGVTDPGVVLVTPEPSGMALPGALGLLLARRVRRPGTR